MTRNHPRTAIVTYKGVQYELNLAACRRALVLCQVDGKYLTMDALAAGVGTSRSTVSRFLTGRQTSLEHANAILTALGLCFRDVAKPYEAELERGAGIA
jgi:hypothetical protein